MQPTLTIAEKCPKCGKNTFYRRNDIKEWCCDACNLRIKDEEY